MTDAGHGLYRAGADAGRPPPDSTEPLEGTLKRHFGFAAFHPGQREPIEAVLAGDDAVVVMPTGSGKSLCYQLPALRLEGVTLVVSPLISLMKDQVDALTARGIPATFLNSTLNAGEVASRAAALRAGHTRLVYVAPERFRNSGFQRLLTSLRVSLLAVDEAHCISQWGHDFRPDYLRLGAAVQALPRVPILALTATATPEVREDIAKQLGLGAGGRRAPRVFVRGFRRGNLRLAVHTVRTHAQKLTRIERILDRFPSGIVYCSTRKQTERVAAMLSDLKIRHLLYHAGLKDDARRQAQERFMSGEVPVVVATNAFGMGVDRADLRFVIHWDIPGSVEAYYQEIGRAGRDGAPAHCELLFNYADVRTQEFFIEGSNPAPELILGVWESVSRILKAEQAVTCSLEDWQARLPEVDNAIAVNTCMGLFDRAGLIQRAVEPGGRRCYTTRLAADADPARLHELLPDLKEKRRRDKKKLADMLGYVGSHRCRHRHILDYFGDRDGDRSACGACDICGLSAVVPPRAPTEAEWIVIQKLLSAVGRLGGRLGRDGILLRLLGFKPAPGVEAGEPSIPEVSTLPGESLDYLRGLYGELVLAGAIAPAVGPDDPAQLTPLGLEIAWRRAPLFLRWAQRGGAVASRPAASGLASVPAGGPRRRKARARPTSRKGVEVDESIYEALRAWRVTEAKRRRVPAYVIFPDRTLEAIAANPPGTLAALGEIPGIGPAKLHSHGRLIMAVLKRLTG